MDFSIEFLLRLLDLHPLPFVDWDDMQGRFAAVIGACQAAGFLSRVPRRHPVPSCPQCGKGVPYPAAGRLLCNRCYGTVDGRHLQCWELSRRRFLDWLRSQLHLRGEVRRIDDSLWQLGTHDDQDGPSEYFYGSGGPVSDAAARQVGAYRSAVVFYGLSPPPNMASLRASAVSIVNVMGLGEALTADASRASPSAGGVRFDPSSGTLEAGNAWLGQIPAGTREYALLAVLAERQGAYVPYANLKREVLRRTGGSDSRDEASFCHRLKSRIKKRHVPRIDALLSTSNKGDGYLLRLRAAIPPHPPPANRGHQPEATPS